MLSEPRCSERKCKWYGGVDQPDGTEETEVCVCPAFPEGIPDEIAYGDDLHLKVTDDQEGDYVFVKKEPIQ